MSPLVRVTVASGSRRVDLLLPGSIPVADLVPELARSIGLLSADTVHAGYRVVTSGGRPLAGDAGLTVQGVEDGGHLTVAAGAHDPPPRLYDDVVEAMADTIEHGLGRWTTAAGRTTARIAAALFLGVGAVALLLQRSDLGAAGACVTASLLVATSIGVSRFHRMRGAALLVAWQGIGYAAVSGFLLVPDEQLLAVRLAAAGAGAMTAGAVTMVGLGEGRPLVGPVMGIGAVFVAAGLAVESTGLRADLVFSTLMVSVVIAGSLCPRLALSAIGQCSPADQGSPVDLRKLSEDTLIGHEILLALSMTVGGAVVLLAPFVVASGPWGVLLAVSACLVLMLRTRHYRVWSEVLVGVASGVLGLVSTATAVLWLHPDWQSGVAVAMAVAGGVLLAATHVQTAPSVRRDRLRDLADLAALASLLPLLMLASGVLANVRA